MKPPQKLLESLIDLETCIEHEFLYFRGIDWTPLVRRTVYFENHEKKSITPKVSSHAEIDVRRSKCTNVWNGRHRSSVKNVNLQVDWLFAALPDSHYLQTNVGMVSPLIDPFLTWMSDKGRLAKVNVSAGAQSNLAYAPDFQFSRSILDRSIVDDVFKDACASFEQLEIRLTQLDLRGYWNIFRGCFSVVVESYLYHLKLLRTVSPRVVLMHNYYSLPMMGLLWAAKECGILTIELQHGVTVPNHPLYVGYSEETLTNGLLADRFFAWDDYSVSPNNVGKQLQGLVTGYVPMLAWQDKLIIADQCAKRSLKDRCNDYTKIVLVCLQTGTDPFPPYVLKVLADRPDTIFLFRGHPKHPREVSNLNDQLEKSGLQNWEIDLATELPLWDCLEIADMYVTRYSSSLIEALNFELPCAIFNLPENEYYSDIIEANACRVYATEAELKDFIDAASEYSKVPSNRELASGSDTLIANLLDCSERSSIETETKRMRSYA